MANNKDFKVKNNLNVLDGNILTKNSNIIGGPSQTGFVSWSPDDDTYDNDYSGAVSSIHESMKRCILNLNGTVNYYLDPNDSTLKEDGSSANLDGSDGYVMVEIPKFYFKYANRNNRKHWIISDTLKSGYQLHPAFIKNGVEVDYRYMGAYDACVYDDSTDSYIAGLNLNDNSSNVDTSVDKLASVSGIYPMVGLTRNECRQLAANNGTGWRQQDFWLSSAVQLLYLVEYGTFNSQSVLGDGNTGLSSYPSSSSDQNDSPHSIAGKSNILGNFSTDTTSGASSGTRDTAFMSYRGIENFFGNCWNWVDGFNILDHVGYITNDDSNFVDDTSDGMQLLGYLSTSTGWATDIIDYPGSFVTSEVGGSSSTFLTDYYKENSGNRVALLGGVAVDGSRAGVFSWDVDRSSGNASRAVGSRVCY